MSQIFTAMHRSQRIQVREYETEELIDKMFDGSAEKFFAAFLGGKRLSKGEIENLKQMIDQLK